MFLKVPEMSLNFKDSGSPMTIIWILMEATCSYESVCPSDLANEEDLKFSKIDASYISSKIGYGV